jgi:hypothetical protein
MASSTAPKPGPTWSSGADDLAHSPHGLQPNCALMVYHAALAWCVTGVRDATYCAVCVCVCAHNTPFVGRHLPDTYMARVQLYVQWATHPSECCQGTQPLPCSAPSAQPLQRCTGITTSDTSDHSRQQFCTRTGFVCNWPTGPHNPTICGRRSRTKHDVLALSLTATRPAVWPTYQQRLGQQHTAAQAHPHTAPPSKVL